MRIGRYLNQFIVTRKDKVQNIVNIPTYGIGIPAIASGSWGFAATDNMDKDNIAKTAEMAVAIARENSWSARWLSYFSIFFLNICAFVA